MNRVLLATCRAKPALTASDARLAAELERLGADTTARPWDAIPPGGEPGAIVCLRSTWDYHRRWTEFRSWIAGFDPRAGTLWNPPETVLWNADKRYLEDLSEAGVAVPRTRWLEPGQRPDCDGILREWNVDRAVLKPRVSATAYGTHVMTAGALLPPDEWEALESAGCLVQAFVPEIETRGEISLVYVDGDFSHAVRKRAARGDFRVQSDFGGTVEPVAPSAAVLRFGDAVLVAATLGWIYARVDLVEAEAGPLLMELELIEPDLFLSPVSAGRLAAALLARTGRTAA